MSQEALGWKWEVVSWSQEAKVRKLEAGGDKEAAEEAFTYCLPAFPKGRLKSNKSQKNVAPLLMSD